MDAAFDNYNPAATVDDGSCANAPVDPIPGCMDAAFDNYNPAATVDDGSCAYSPEVIPACADSKANNYEGPLPCLYDQISGQVLIPVTGMDFGPGRFGSQGMFLASIAFFGFGLVMAGIARKREEQNLKLV